MIRTMEDVILFVRKHMNEEIEASTYGADHVWCRILKNRHCIDHDTDGIIGVELPALYRYIWKHRKTFNMVIAGTIDFTITKLSD